MALGLLSSQSVGAMCLLAFLGALCEHGLFSLCWAIQALQRITERPCSKKPFSRSTIARSKLLFLRLTPEKKGKKARRSAQPHINDYQKPGCSCHPPWQNSGLSTGLQSCTWASTSTCSCIKTSTSANGQWQLQTRQTSKEGLMVSPELLFCSHSSSPTWQTLPFPWDKKGAIIGILP